MNVPNVEKPSSRNVGSMNVREFIQERNLVNVGKLPFSQQASMHMYQLTQLTNTTYMRILENSLMQP